MSTEKSTGFSHRIRHVREAVQLKKDEFAKRVNVSGAYIGQLESGKKENPSDLFLETICREFSINSAWIRTGKGEMFKEGEPQGDTRGKQALSRGKVSAEGAAHLLPLNPEDVVVMQVYVTGGAGAPYEFIPSEPIEEIIVPKAYYTRSIIPVKVRGRSMERTLRDGAVVGVDRSDRLIVNGELYAVWLPYQGTVIKRLYLDDKMIQLQSDNEEFRPRDIEVALDEVDDNFIQGRVKWVIQML